jgi:hypothetical protein
VETVDRNYHSDSSRPVCRAEEKKEEKKAEEKENQRL